VEFEMTHVFGDRSDFAIEAGVEPDLNPPSAVWGHMCVWCRGMPLGDIDERHCCLNHARTSFRWKARHLDELWAPELVGLDDLATCNFLDGLLYGYHGDVELRDDPTVEMCRANGTAWYHFDFLTNWGEQFDGCKAFILCPPGGPVRILSRRFPAGMGYRVDVSQSAFKEASLGFVQWYEEQESRLRGET
jgi:hypothetical protein